jgi:hypothetical protein
MLSGTGLYPPCYFQAMDDTRPLPFDRLAETLATDGFAFVRAPVMERLLAAAAPLSDWDAFAASWDDLSLDTYMADRGRYRKRRHAVFAARADGAVTRQKHQPHYQGLDYNPLNGGVERWFEPILPEIAAGPSMTAILGFCRGLFERLAPTTRAWHIEAHQFRIEARPGEEGRPTPEGLHRDGVDYVLVLLIRRRNIVSGTTSIHAVGDKRHLGSFTLTEPFDAALVDDRRVYHGVTPVEPQDPASSAYRDVLVVTFKKS